MIGPDPEVAPCPFRTKARRRPVVDDVTLSLAGLPARVFRPITCCSSPFTEDPSALAHFVTAHPRSALASLVKRGRSWTHAQKSVPPDSILGRLLRQPSDDGALLRRQLEPHFAPRGDHRLLCVDANRRRGSTTTSRLTSTQTGSMLGGGSVQHARRAGACHPRMAPHPSARSMGQGSAAGSGGLDPLVRGRAVDVGHGPSGHRRCTSVVSRWSRDDEPTITGRSPSATTQFPIAADQ